MCTAQHNCAILRQIKGRQRFPQICLCLPIGKIPLLGKLHQPRQRQQIHLMMLVHLMQQILQFFFPNCHRRSRHQDAFSTMGVIHRRFYRRLHSQNGKTVTSAQIFNGHAGRRIARHHQSLYALLGNKIHCFLHILLNFLFCLAAIRHMICICIIQIILLRHGPFRLMQYGQASNT